MEDPNLTFTLKPMGEHAIRALGLDQNRNRYIPATLEQIAPCREITPATNAGDNDGEGERRWEENVEEDLTSKLVFTFDNKPKYIKRGFVFGGSSSKC